MLSPGNINKIISIGCVNGILVSLDGLTETHNTIRGANIYDKVLKNLELLITKRNQLHLNLIIGVNTVLTKKNIDEVFPLIKELNRIGVDYWNGLELIDFDKDTGKYKLEFTLDEILQILKKLCDLQRSIDIKIIPTFTFPFIVAYVNKVNKSNLDLPEHLCNAGLSFAYLDWKGRIYPCDRVTPKNKDIKLLYENLYEKELLLQDTPLIDCLSSDLFKKFSFLYADEDTIAPACYGCPFYKHECYPCMANLKYHDSSLCCTHCLELKERIINEFIHTHYRQNHDNRIYSLQKTIIYYENKNIKYVFDIKKGEVYQLDSHIMQLIICSLHNQPHKKESDLFYTILTSSTLKINVLQNAILQSTYDIFMQELGELLEQEIVYKEVL